MPLKHYLTAYLASLTTFLALDAAWLGYIAIDFYRAQLGDLLLEDANMGIALLFYLFYVVGVVIFAIKPAIEKNCLKTAIILGGLLGLLAYGTYDMTNMATLKDWPVKMSLLDMVWGAFITSMSATVGYVVTNKLMTRIRVS